MLQSIGVLFGFNRWVPQPQITHRPSELRDPHPQDKGRVPERQNIGRGPFSTISGTLRVRNRAGGPISN
jgi:hypothetical protein